MTELHADTREYLVVHRALRVTLDRFATASERIDPARLAEVLPSRWRLFTRLLHHHHEVEDNDFFPMIQRSAPDMAPLIARLEREHQELIAKLDAAESAVAALESNARDDTKRAAHDAIQAVRDELFPHLDVEDAELLPAAAKAVPGGEWKRLSEHAMKTIPKADLPVAAGALDEVVRSLPKEQWPPPPPVIVRVLVTVSWRKRYAKFIEPLVA